ncbi:sperm flagellar protein 1 isoform X3 [Neovison vison]|uniref:sperm flagellar protein 1 isoform X3 n=1 Tax=Neovison vison TaxID=452646 RepID=UPI001CF0850F|nr:sperm flagellar protein 1 isoform X3 [Neogale vison]
MPELRGMGCLSFGVCWRMITDFWSCFLEPLSLSSTTPASLSSFPFPHHLFAWPHHSAIHDSPIPSTSSHYSFSLTSLLPSMSAPIPSVLVAEVIKFYFPKMVEMHNYVPANSLQQKLSNWGHLNRKVLNKLNFSVPEDVMRKIAQCAPGVVELVLIPLRQRLEERQRLRKQRTSSLQELAPQDGTGYMDVGLSQKARGEGAPDPQGGGQVRSCR